MGSTGFIKNRTTPKVSDRALHYLIESKAKFSYNCCSGKFSHSLGSCVRYPGSFWGSSSHSHLVYSTGLCSPSTCQLGPSLYRGYQETCCKPNSYQPSCVVSNPSQTYCYCPRTSTLYSSCQMTYTASLGFSSRSNCSLDYRSRSCYSQGCRSTGFRPLGYRVCGFCSLGYGSRFCCPTYFSSRSF
ncbi:keratin-associated protein 13-2-like [Elephas maximus indicus]|uniref:keratin-associated protein 13-2-like n=1 Tax=Elephas maximus indicus TaxID=99487 RepID=UPI002116939F|nr:keratin-associated protein 13-2-like [Elephas maximus indicus]